MSVTITGPIAPKPGQVSGTSSTVDRQADLGFRTEPSPGTALPPSGVAPEPVTTPSPVTLPPVVAPGDAVLDGDGARRGSHGRVNRGQVRSQLSHLANAVKHGLKELAKSGELDDSAEHELRTLARTFKSSVKSLFQDSKDSIRSGEFDADGLLADVRAAYGDVRASASAILAPAADNATAATADGDIAVVASPAAGSQPVADADATGAADVEPLGSAAVVADAPTSTGAPVPDPLASLDAVFDEFLAALSDLLSRFALDGPQTPVGGADGTPEAGVQAPAEAAADASLYERVSSTDDTPAGGFDKSA